LVHSGRVGAHGRKGRHPRFTRLTWIPMQERSYGNPD
jgi:hypothetical protein